MCKKWMNADTLCKNAGKTMYVYSVDLKERMKVIETQQNEIQQLKQQLEEKDKLLKCYQEEEKLIADILGDKDLTIIGSRVYLKNFVVELENLIKELKGE